MSREIKFRGLLQSGLFIYGSYVTDGKDYHAILHESPDDSELMINTPVIPESVGQCTEVKDNNYIEVWEGDIVEEVRLLSDGKRVTNLLVEYKAPSWVAGKLDLSNYMGITFKVIGNIHQNPGLLESEK